MDLTKWWVFSMVKSELLEKIRFASVIGNDASVGIFITDDDEAYICQRTGDTQNTLLPRKFSALCGIKVKGFSSATHLLAFTEEGKVYTWENTDLTSTLPPRTESVFQFEQNLIENTNTPVIIGSHLADKKVIQVACGNYHSLALVSNGDVFTWGALNKFDPLEPELVTCFHDEYRCTSKCADGVDIVVQIACTSVSSLALKETGEVYAWGCNDKGQLGSGNFESCHAFPIRVKGLEGKIIKKVVCGYNHAMALTTKGDLYAWGDNEFGQLGIGNKVKQCVAQQVALTEVGKIVDMATTLYSNESAAINRSGKIYIWGQCKGASIFTPTETAFGKFIELFAAFDLSPVIWERREANNCEDENLAGFNVSNSLKLAFDDESTSDLIIKVEGKLIYVHKAILMIRCEHFKNMFLRDWQESKKTEIEIDHFTYPTYRAFLYYLYSDELIVPTEKCIEFIDLITSYCEKNLVRKYEQMLKQEVTLKNVGVMCTAAVNYNLKFLEEACLQFAVREMKDLSQTDEFENLDPEILRRIISSVGKYGD